MRSLPLPTLDLNEVYDKCVDRFQNPELRERLNLVKPTVCAHSESYQLRGMGKALYTILPNQPIDPASNVEMCGLYSEGLVRRRAPARVYYEILRLSSPYNICPTCNHRTVGTLDHYLPKTKFSHLTVTPMNLVPSCYDCNVGKRAAVGTTFSDFPLHPYFDDPGEDLWLEATLVDCAPLVCTFDVNRLLVAGGLGEKVQNHMKAFGLHELYSTEAAAELSRSIGLFRSLFESGGQGRLFGYLSQKHESILAVERNSWREALYRACSQTEWFSSGSWL